MSKGNRTRRRELGLLPEPSKCIGRKKDGTPCRRSPIKGATVCRAHGGAAPQVQRKAQERIAHASDVAVLQILALMQAPDTPAPVKLAAAKDLLDRANISGRTTIEVEVPQWKDLLGGIVASVDPDAVPMRTLHETDDDEAEDDDDPLVIEAQRADQFEELARYQAESGVYEHFHPDAAGSGMPAQAPRREPATPTGSNGADRPPPVHAVPERRRIEPDDPDYWQVPRTYTPSPRQPRRGRTTGRRR